MDVMRCSVLLVVAVCCSVRVALCCSVWKMVKRWQLRYVMCCSVLRCVAVCCSVLESDSLEGKMAGESCDVL